MSPLEKMWLVCYTSLICVRLLPEGLPEHPEGPTPAGMRTLRHADKSRADTCLGRLRYGLVQRVGGGAGGR
jgi:hypothetical protein